jgi:YggT family protein
VPAVLVRTIMLFLQIYSWLILARVLLSWIRPGGGFGRRGGGDFLYQVQDFLYRVTDPILEPIRRILPTSGMGLDLSPLVALLVIQMLTRLVAQLAYRY